MLMLLPSENACHAADAIGLDSAPLLMEARLRRPRVRPYEKRQQAAETKGRDQ
jgi:hypothetical protein